MGPNLFKDVQACNPELGKCLIPEDEEEDEI